MNCAPISDLPEIDGKPAMLGDKPLPLGNHLLSDTDWTGSLDLNDAGKREVRSMATSEATNRRWLEAIIALHKDPEAQVACPKCGKANMTILDVPNNDKKLTR